MNDYQVRRYADARRRVTEARRELKDAWAEMSVAMQELETAGSALAERIQITASGPPRPQASLFPDKASA